MKKNYYAAFKLILGIYAILSSCGSCTDPPGKIDPKKKGCNEYELILVINDNVFSKGLWPDEVVHLMIHPDDNYFECDELEFSTGIFNVELFTQRAEIVKTGFDTKNTGGLNLGNAKSRNNFLIKKWHKENKIAEGIVEFVYEPTSQLYLKGYLNDKSKTSHVFVYSETFMGDSLFEMPVISEASQMRSMINAAQCNDFRNKVYVMYKPKLETSKNLEILGANKTQVGKENTYTIQGGIGPYKWLANGSSKPTTTGETHTTSYTRAGQFSIQVSDAVGQITELSVSVTGLQPKSIETEHLPKEKVKLCDPEKAINVGIDYNQSTGVVTWNKNPCLDRVEIYLTKTSGDCPDLPASQSKFPQKGGVGLISVRVEDGIHATSSCKFKITLIGYNADNQQLTLINNTLSNKRMNCSK